VYNASTSRAIVVTHIWFETSPRTHVIARRPPDRLEADAHWETWIEAAKLPLDCADPTRLARVKLSDGSTFESEPRTDVPSQGYVPG
jgi:hypothetical protein